MTDAQPLYKRTVDVFKTFGRATSYTPYDNGYTISTKPTYQQLSAYDEAVRKEPIIKQGIEFIVLSLVNRLGSFEHVNPQIEDYVNKELDGRVRKWITNATFNTLVFGHSLSETLYHKKRVNGRLVASIEDIVQYHPLSSIVIVNNYGRVVDGEKVYNSMYTSGYWVPLPVSSYIKPPTRLERVGMHVRLPRIKRWFTTWGDDGNNPWGRSILTSVLPYHLFKEAFRDLMFIALDRYGTPIIYVIVPPSETGRVITEPSGEERVMTMKEEAEEALSNLGTQNGSGIVLTAPIAEGAQVKIGALTTGNNFSDSFERALATCDTNMMIGLGIPNLLVHNRETGLGTGRATEIQVELFDSLVDSIYEAILQPFVSQVVRSLIDLNFDPSVHKGAEELGKIVRRPTRTGDISATVDSFHKLFQMKVVDINDRDHIRKLLNLPT
jgi:hypothetical protein